MAYCAKCGTKNDDNAVFCSKCGQSLSGDIKKSHNKDDDCVCSGSQQNPMVPIFWGVVIILVGLWIIVSFVIPESYLPPIYGEISFGTLIVIIIALAIIFTGIRILTKRNQ